jgi:putative ATPase
MRPRTLDEYVGQEQVLGPGMPLRQAILDGKLGSVVLWAPPGCGKTTLAHIIADATGAHLEVRSAVTAGVGDVRKIAEAARDRRRFHGQATVLLLDEIHHFNKSQQDALLGDLEAGTYSLVGATTENPFFVLNDALLSRARVVPLKPLAQEDIGRLVERALADTELGLGDRRLSLSDEARGHLLRSADGDARLALNALEAASLLVPDGREIGLPLVEQVLQRPAVRYDRQGDQHYDTVSAFIKSVRGSDSDAALHYLARMLSAGEDPRFIVRRLAILASEDIGNAEPQALVLAAATAQIVERIGMPEGRIALAQLTTFLAEAPKSNRAYMAIEKAFADLEGRVPPPVPMHLRNAPLSGLEALGHGEGYDYPHDDPRGWVEQRYLPEGRFKTPYYEPSGHGYEARIQERRARRDRPEPEPTDG